MATIRRFEDIHAWQSARELARIVYGLTRHGALSKDFGMRDQIQRAAVSVGSNIAEGFARSGNKEFLNFLWIAHGSVAEVQSQLYTILDAGYISDADFNSVYDCAKQCSILIYKLIDALKKASYAGERHRVAPAQLV